MEIDQLNDIVNSKARQAALAKMVANDANRVMVIDGLAGSATAMLVSRLPKRATPYLVIANDLDEAGSSTVP